MRVYGNNSLVPFSALKILESFTGVGFRERDDTGLKPEKKELLND